MKIMCDNEVLLEVNDTQKKIIADCMIEDTIEHHLKHLATYFIMKDYDACYKMFYDRWMPVLIEKGIESVPVDQLKFAQLVFSQSFYKDRATRDAEEKAHVIAAQQAP